MDRGSLALRGLSWPGSERTSGGSIIEKEGVMQKSGGVGVYIFSRIIVR